MYLHTHIYIYLSIYLHKKGRNSRTVTDLRRKLVALKTRNCFMNEQWLNILQKLIWYGGEKLLYQRML